MAKSGAPRKARKHSPKWLLGAAMVVLHDPEQKEARQQIARKYPLVATASIEEIWNGLAQLDFVTCRKLEKVLRGDLPEPADDEEDEAEETSAVAEIDDDEDDEGDDDEEDDGSPVVTAGTTQFTDKEEDEEGPLGLDEEGEPIRHNRHQRSKPAGDPGAKPADAKEQLGGQAMAKVAAAVLPRSK